MKTFKINNVRQYRHYKDVENFMKWIFVSVAIAVLSVSVWFFRYEKPDGEVYAGGDRVTKSCTPGSVMFNGDSRGGVYVCSPHGLWVPEANPPSDRVLNRTKL